MHHYVTAALMVAAILFVVLGLQLLTTTIYLHRDLTHGSITVKGNLRMVFRWITFLAGVNPMEWVAVHRKHHRFSDHAPDPHSPWNYMPHGLRNIFFTNAAKYHQVAKDSNQVTRYAHSFEIDELDRKIFFRPIFGPLVAMPVFYFALIMVLRTIVFVPAWMLIFQVALAGLLAPVLYMAGGSLINSIGHSSKSIDIKTGDHSRNLKWAAWLTFGEGMHHNHHLNQNSASFHGDSSPIWDPGWLFISVMRRVGLIEVKQRRNALMVA